MAAPVFGTTDILALGADWEPQGDSPATVVPTRVAIPGPTGDIVASTTHNPQTTSSTKYIYIGAETAFIAAFAAASCDVGDLIAATKFITGIAIDYSPCAAGQRPVVTFSWRTGPTTSPATPYVYLTAQVLPTYAVANVAVPTIFSITAGSAEVTNAQWSLSCSFGEDLDKSGAYLDGNGYNGEEKIDLTFAGIPTSITSTGFQYVGGAQSTTQNNGYNQATYSYIRSVTRS